MITLTLILGVAASAGLGLPPQPSVCTATATSLTPAGWTVPAFTGNSGVVTAPFRPLRTGVAPLVFVRDIPLPGPALRFDYQSLDTGTDRLYIAHMGAGRLVVVDTKTQHVVQSVPGFGGATGVWAVPELWRVYVSVTQRHEVAVVEMGIDQAVPQVIARVRGIRFPDGIAYAPDEQRLFVSDELGESEAVIDIRANTLVRKIPLGGEAGNTRYDPVSHCVLVAVQTENQLVAIDPATLRVVARYALPGSDYPHGFVLDEQRRLAFVACEKNATVLTVDLRKVRVLGRDRVGDDPDVVAHDPVLHRLYVAAESGVVTSFDVQGTVPRSLGVLHIPHAHSVVVDPHTHLVYLPLEEVAGRPVLRVMRP